MAIKNPIQPTTRVLTFEWYVPDNWYGKNYRAVLLKEDSPIHFETISEAKKYRSKFAKLIKSKFSEAKPTAKKMIIGNYAEFETYKYYGSGPSYACTNIHFTVEQLEEFLS